MKNNMYKIITLGLAMLVSLASFAQRNVTQFMGIPVDGTKASMIQKLKAKGFTYNTRLDCLEGDFNGRSVYIHIVTNNNKVYRIMVSDAIGSDEGYIKIRFNNLLRQFQKNERYIPSDMVGDYEIGEDEDISYEMNIKNKRYQAAFFQVNKDTDNDTTGGFAYMKKYVENRTDELADMTEEEMMNALELQATMFMLSKIQHKSVWYTISEKYGRYFINMYYDNELNQANGDDL